MVTKNLFEFIRSIPLLSFLADEELSSLMEEAELRSVSAGELVFDQGDEGDSFYIVYSGKIRIVQKNEQGREINLGVNTKGDHFGETSLITESPRNAAARAVEESVLVVFTRELFNKHLFSRPALRDYFDKFIKCTSINRFLKTCTNLSVVPPKDLQELLSKFTSEFFKEGDVVFRQGSQADAFYLVESGKLKVAVWKNDKQEIVNFLREGDFFGEKALVENTSRTADVICLTDCHLFSLSKEDFNTLVLKSPQLKKVIEDRIGSYLTSSSPLPYQEIIKQELAALQDIKVKKEAPKEEKPTAKPAAKAPAKGSLIAAIRIRGEEGVRVEIKDALDSLRLRKKHVCVLFEDTPTVRGQLKKAKDFITFGTITAEVKKELEEKRGKGKAFYALHPPRGGFEKKGIKVAFTAGGALGDRGSKMGDLIKRML